MSTEKSKFNWQTQFQIIGKISTAIVTNKQRLDTSYQASRSAELAWSARNLLELLVWALYCTKSQENACHFMEESLRDTHMILTIPDELLVAGESLASQRERFLVDTAQDGWANIDKRFTSISEIADWVGIKHFFSKYNMILSKYAHPTALSIISPDLKDSSKDSFYTMGNEWYVAALSTCKTFIDTHAG